MKLSWLLMFDLFGKQPGLYINQKERYGTIYGLLISIITACGIVGFTLYFFAQMFLRTDMNLIQSVELPEKPLVTNLQDNHFFISLSLQDPLSYDAFVDNEIYTVEAFYKETKRKSNGDFEWVEKPLEIMSCSEVKIKEEYKDFFKYKPLNQLYCLKNPNFDLQGTFVNDYYSMVMFKIYKCSETNGNKCKSKEQMDYYLNGTFVQLMLSDISIDSRNYHSPEKPILSEAYSTVSIDYIKEMHVFLKSAIVTTEENLYFKTLRKSAQYSQLDYIKDMQRSKLNQHVNQNQLCEITLKLNNKIDQYKRSYLTITTVISNVGGLIKAITFVASMLTLFVGNLQYDMFLSNQLFSHSSPFNKDRAMNITTNESIQLSLCKPNINQSKYTPSIFTLNTKQNQIQKHKGFNCKLNSIHHIPKIFQSNKDFTYSSNNFTRRFFDNSSSFSFFQVLSSKLFPCCDRNKSHIKKFDQNVFIMRSMLDILNVNKTIIDLQRLKSIALSNEESILFDLQYKLDSLDFEQEIRKIERLYKDDYSECFNINVRNAYLGIKKKTKGNERTVIDVLDRMANQIIFYNNKNVD